MERMLPQPWPVMPEDLKTEGGSMVHLHPVPKASGRDRRRAERARPDEVCVRIQRTEGLVIDISETGVLIRIPVPQAADAVTSMSLDWLAGFVRLNGRVIRSVPCLVHQPAGAPAKTEHLVAIEFLDVSDKSAAALQRLIEGA